MQFFSTLLHDDSFVHQKILNKAINKKSVMKKIFFAVIIFSSASFISCKKDIAGSSIVSAANESSFKRKPGTVTGAVIDSWGNPLSNVSITVEHTVWYGTYLFGKTNANG